MTPGLPCLLDRSIYSGETTVTGELRVRAWCDAGTEGRVRVETSLGTHDVDFSNTSATTHSASITLHAEDLSTVDGRRSAEWLDAVITGWRTSGAGTVRVSGVSIFGRGA